MKFLTGKESERAMQFINEAVKLARKSTCERSKCGSVIVSGNEIIGSGFNSPPGNIENQKRCKLSKADFDLKVTDKTCCVHAEQRAIMDALRKNPDKILGARLYFSRLGKDGELSFAGKPYCTICSKMVLDVGISEFVLFRERGICVYDSREYNDLSFGYS